jgi:hypothetical protein
MVSVFWLTELFFAGSSREETFFEASPWLESDCDDDFYSVNEANDEPFGHRYDFVPNISEVSFNQQWHLVPASSDLTPARSFSSQTSGRIASYAVASKNLPTLGAILKAEPLKPPAPHMRKLGDLLREPQDDDGGLSRADSLRLAEEANRCCVPQLARAISCNGTRRSKG